MPAWATNVSAGPADESGQTLTFFPFYSNPALFATGPTISAAGTLSYTPAANASGTSVVAVTLQDSGSSTPPNENTSPQQTFNIIILNQTANLAITKTRGGVATPSFGQPFAYSLAVSNAGPDAADSVSVTDVLPTGLAFVSANATQGSCAEASGTVTCSLGTIANGGTASATINVTATAATPITNTATVSSSATDPVPGNNSASDSTIVGYGPCAVPTFNTFIPDGVQAQATFLATGDFNKDGVQDVVVSDGPFGYVRVFLADPLDPGGYNHTDYSIGLGAPNGIVVQDFDGDTNLDLAVAVNNGANSRIALFKGSASGAFPQTPLTTTVPAGPSFPFAADFDGSGRPDVAVGNGAGTTFSVLLWNTGTGNFSAPASVTSGPSSGLNLIVEDFDGNGTLDIATPNIGSSFFTILSGNGDGTFAQPGTTIPLPSPYLMNRLRQVGDVNGDGRPDLGATLGTGTPNLINLALFYNTGGFSFGAPVEILPESYSVGLFVLGDVTGDGKATSSRSASSRQHRTPPRASSSCPAMVPATSGRPLQACNS